MKSYLIGRHPECCITIDDPTVSRVHARLNELEDGHSYLLIDESSSCGTYLLEGSAWRRVTNVRATVGDKVRFGGYNISVCELINAARRDRARPTYVERDFATGELIVRST